MYEANGTYPAPRSYLHHHLQMGSSQRGTKVSSTFMSEINAWYQWEPVTHDYADILRHLFLEYWNGVVRSSVHFRFRLSITGYKISVWKEAIEVCVSNEEIWQVTKGFEDTRISSRQAPMLQGHLRIALEGTRWPSSPGKYAKAHGLLGL